MQKKFFAVAAFAFAFAFAFTANAAWDFGSATIKKGSTGQYAMNAQAAFNACNNAGLTVDGKFGTKSVAAAKAFQASKGLTADGYVGLMTKAALNSCGAPSNPSNPSNPIPSNPSGAPLSINSVQATSGYYNTSVGVGQVDKPVANIRVVTGAGGSANLTGLNVSFYNMGSGDYQFSKYAQNVGVWLNGAKIGSLDVSQFTDYNSIFSAYIPVSGGTLAANSTNNIVLSVSSLPTIDSANMTSDAWGVDVTSIRYQDSTGVFTYNPAAVFGAALTSSSTTSTQNTYFQFSSAASAQSIKLTVSKNINDSNDSVVIGSAGANTPDIKLAMVDLNAQGDSIRVRRLPVTLTVGGSATIPSAVLNTLRLYDASGNLLDSQAVTASTTPATITFQNLNVTVPKNQTLTFTIKGDFNTVGSTGFAAGDSAAVSVSSTNVGNIQAYDSGSNVLNNNTVTTLTGSTTGNNVSMYVNGINVTAYGTPSTSVAPAGGAQNHSTVTYTIPFSVTAFGAVAYIPSTAAAVAGSASATNKIQFCVDATTACAAAGSGIVSYLGSDNLTASGNGTFQIPIGQTKNFQLVITYQPASAISTRASLINVNWSAADSTSGGTWNTYTAGLSSNAFKTPYAAAQ